jgi:hypothetical protein
MSKLHTGNSPGYEQRPGSWRVICAWSGFKIWNTDAVRQWDGEYVLKRFCDERNPQDFVKGVPDLQNVPWTRPEQEDQFITVPVSAADL